MKVIKTAMPGLLIVEPNVFSDQRGYFFESFNKREFNKLTGLDVDFVQDNHSFSKKNVLRGMHYQIHRPQGKLIRVTQGRVFDVVVDLRRHSPTFGKHVSVELSAENNRMLWLPAGFAHGFLTTSDTAEMIYKTTDYWMPEYERCISWNDPSIGIDWPLKCEPIMSLKDGQGKVLGEADLFD